MSSRLVVRASDCQCRSRNSPGFDPSILRHSGIWGAADETVLNTVHRRKKNPKNPPVRNQNKSVSKQTLSVRIKIKVLPSNQYTLPVWVKVKVLATNVRSWFIWGYVVSHQMSPQHSCLAECLGTPGAAELFVISVNSFYMPLQSIYLGKQILTLGAAIGFYTSGTTSMFL
jgi:hypothetical protein